MFVSHHYVYFALRSQAQELTAAVLVQCLEQSWPLGNLLMKSLGQLGPQKWFLPHLCLFQMSFEGFN